MIGTNDGPKYPLSEGSFKSSHTNIITKLIKRGRRHLNKDYALGK
jgi:hypothetical protein